MKHSISLLAFSASLLACHGANQDTTTTTTTLPAASSAAPTISAKPAQATATTATWNDARSPFTFDYPSFLTASYKPDGVSLASEPLAVVDDPSGGECAKAGRKDCRGGPTPLKISVSVRAGSMLAAWKATDAHSFATYFPSGTETSFKPDATGFKKIVGGHTGYRIIEGAEGTSRDYTYAPLDDHSSIEVECRYVGDTFKPKRSQTEQVAACDAVLDSLRMRPH